MTKNNKNEVATTATFNAIKSLNDLPTILPDIDKKELFNKVQESEPIANLQGKQFKIVGIIPEIVEVPKNVNIESGEVEDNPFTEGELVERLRVTLLTDIGVFHSFSVTFNKALAKALTVFQDEFSLNTYEISLRMRGSGDNAKAYYIVKAV